MLGELSLYFFLYLAKILSSILIQRTRLCSERFKLYYMQNYVWFFCNTLYTVTL